MNELVQKHETFWENPFPRSDHPKWLVGVARRPATWDGRYAAVISSKMSKESTSEAGSASGAKFFSAEINGTGVLHAITMSYYNV